MVIANGHVDLDEELDPSGTCAWRSWPLSPCVVTGVFDRLVIVQRGIQAVAALVTQDMQRVTQVKGVAVGVGALIRRCNRLEAAVVIALSLTGVGEVFAPSLVGLGIGALACLRFFGRTSAGRFLRR